MANKALFLDRDGTINVDAGYLYRPEDFVWIEGAIDAIRYANAHGYLVIVVTNQSGVARGYFTEDDVNKLHAWMNDELKPHGAHIDAFYYCPYLADGSVPAYAKPSPDRKPAPGMVLKALADYDIDPAAAYLVGDRPRDVECARNAGIVGVIYPGGSLLNVVKKILP